VTAIFTSTPFAQFVDEPVIGAALMGDRVRTPVGCDPRRRAARSSDRGRSSGAGQVDLAPRVQIGEVALAAARAIEGFHVGLELYQVIR